MCWRLLMKMKCRFSRIVAEVGFPYLLVCRILSKMADPFFSSLWRIQQPYGCTYIYQDRVRDFDAAMSAAAALAHL
jgi:hypothetical protein